MLVYGSGDDKYLGISLKPAEIQIASELPVLARLVQLLFCQRWSFQSKYLIIQLQQLVSDLDGWYHIVTQDYCGEEDEEGGREEEGGEAGEGLKDDTFLRASQEALECVVLHRRPEVFHGLEQ